MLPVLWCGHFGLVLDLQLKPLARTRAETGNHRLHREQPVAPESVDAALHVNPTAVTILISVLEGIIDTLNGSVFGQTKYPAHCSVPEVYIGAAGRGLPPVDLGG
jgi:hypothetical protein